MNLIFPLQAKKNEIVAKMGVERGIVNILIHVPRFPLSIRLEATFIRFYPNENPRSIKAPRFHRNTCNLRYVSGWARTKRRFSEIDHTLLLFVCFRFPLNLHKIFPYKLNLTRRIFFLSIRRGL